MQRCTINSAMSVRRSLTDISGRRPVRSANATANTAAFWNCRSASTWRSGSSPGTARCAPRAPARSRRGWQLLERLLIDQFVEQQRKFRDLARQKAADRRHLDQPVERRRLLLEQRQVRGAHADRLQNAQHPLHHDRRLGRPRGESEHAGENDVRPGGGRLRPACDTARRADTPVASRRRQQWSQAASATGELCGDVAVVGGEPFEPGVRARLKRVRRAEHQRLELPRRATARRARSHGRPPASRAHPSPTRAACTVRGVGRARRESVRRGSSARHSPPCAAADRPRRARRRRCRTAVWRPPAAAARRAARRTAAADRCRRAPAENDCTMNSISRMPPLPSFRSCSSSRRATSRAISAFISRSESNTPKSR